MRLQDLNWMDVDRYLETDNRIILITGATQQHAFLSMMTDVLIPSRLADAVAEREKVLVAPSLNFGVSQVFSEFPGTISFSRHTFEYALLEIVESLFHQGFRRFFIMNGHGDNELPERLQDFQMDGVLRVLWYEWWRGQASHDFQHQHHLQLDHANWGENFPFNRVAKSPEGEKMPINLGMVDEWRSAREVMGDGNFGGPYQLDDTLMNELFALVVDEAAEQIRTMRDDTET